ncbi:hypothetical protein Tco_0355205 [Tanacetum coccineum]
MVKVRRTDGVEAERLNFCISSLFQQIIDSSADDGLGAPRQRKPQKHNEEKGAPQIPIPQRLARILPKRIRKHHQFQITHNPRQIPLHRIPYRLSQRVRSRSKSSQTRRLLLLLNWLRRRDGFCGDSWREVGWDERGGGRGDGDGGAWGRRAAAVVVELAAPPGWVCWGRLEWRLDGMKGEGEDGDGYGGAWGRKVDGRGGRGFGCGRS